MEKSLHFSITGEYITKTARDWFFKEKKDYKKSEELILSCCENTPLTLEEKRELAKDIIEGKFKFIGVNDLELVDDGENIRTIMEELEDREKELKIKLLIKDIEERPFMYLDRFALRKSLEYFKKNADNVYSATLEDLIREFGYTYQYVDKSIDDILKDTRQVDKYLQYGLYVILEPRKWAEIIFNTIKSDNLSSSDYTNYKLEYCLTEYWNTILNEWKNQGKNYANMTNHEKIVYERQLQICEYFNIDFPFGNTIYSKGSIKGIKEKEKDIKELDIPAIDKLKKSFDFRDYKKEHHDNWDAFVRANFDLGSIGIADNVYQSQWGIMDPQGHWYSCDFGGHTVKALAIISADKNLTDDYIKWLKENNLINDTDKTEKYLREHIRYCGVITGFESGIEFLMKRKWCKVSNTAGGTPIPVVEDEIRGLTKAQEKTYFEVREFFKNR